MTIHNHTSTLHVRKAFFFVNSIQENTFQVVLATDGEVSFVFFIYGDIEWGFSNIGFRNSDGSRNFMVPGALTSRTVDIELTSNVGVPGLYIYRVDLEQILGPNGIVSIQKLIHSERIEWHIL